MAQARALVLFDISRYLTDKYFDIVWGFQTWGFGAAKLVPPGTSPNRPHKKQFFKRIKLGCQCFMISSRYLTDKYFDIAWGCHSPGDPRNGPPKNQFFERLNLGCQFVLISVDI